MQPRLWQRLQNAFSGAEQRMEELTRRLDVPGGRRWGRSSRSPLMRVDEDWERKALATPAIPDVAPMSRSPSDGTVSTISTEWLDARLQHDLHKSCPQICWELPCLRKMVLGIERGDSDRGSVASKMIPPSC